MFKYLNLLEKKYIKILIRYTKFFFVLLIKFLNFFIKNKYIEIFLINIIGWRELININKSFAIPTLNDLSSKVTFSHLNIKSDKWIISNPSIYINKKNQIFCIATQTNRYMTRLRRDKLISGKEFRSRLVFFQLSKKFKILNLRIIKNTSNNFGHEFADARLIKVGKSINFSASISFLKKNNIFISLNKVKKISDLKVTNENIFHSPFNYMVEKNWMPILGTSLNKQIFIYKISPTIVLETKNKTLRILSKSQGPKSLLNARGGSQLIEYKKNNWLSVVHHTYHFDRRYYSHRFVTYTLKRGLFKISGYSNEFCLIRNREIEFANGLSIFKKNIIISFGYRDNESWLVSLPIKDVFKSITN